MTKIATEVEALKAAVRRHLVYSAGKQPERATEKDTLRAVSLATRDRVIDAMLATEERYRKSRCKRLAYLSMEFLMGRSLENNLLNLGLLDAARTALASGPAGAPDFEHVVESEDDAALGNGGLGRLAACFLDSLASLDLPGFGYGINYEFGLFQQHIDGGEQRERPDQWLGASSPWLLERADEAVIVPVYGRIEETADRDGNYNPMWLDWKVIVGVPHDMPVVGYGGKTVNVLRLYSARGSRELDMETFNDGDYVRAIEEKVASETISKILYPSDARLAGRELRLLQEYFLVACAMRDVMRGFMRTGEPIEAFASKVAVQLNDTHPALTVAELMRLLIDEHSMEWDVAWQTTQAALAYTNHTLLPEALEKWPVDLLKRVLPRHAQIIFEINRRFLDEVSARFPSDPDRMRRMSIIEECEPRQVRMAYLSIVGSHSVNGVAALHSELVKTALVPDFHQMWPERFNNKTNGVTPRRWIKQANPGLATLLNQTIGEGWVTNLDEIRSIERFATDRSFQHSFEAVKQQNKVRLASLIRELTREAVDPSSIFDVQIKRVHEYKRQLLNVLHIVHRYLAIVDDNADLGPARTFIFAGKAAPGYYLAKRVIRLIHDVAAVVNRDPRSRDKMRVIFLPDYRVSLAEKIVPAADLSEQISTAGKEASGTGNMKLSMNGALTIGTLDGANVEIRDAVGNENIFIFGLEVADVERMALQHSYDPHAYVAQHADIRRVIESLLGTRFSGGVANAHHALVERIMRPGEEYVHLADMHAYVAAQARVSSAYDDRPNWSRMAILNVARMGKFSSDRTIREYAADIWNLSPVR